MISRTLSSCHRHLVRKAYKIAHDHDILHNDVEPRHVLWRPETRQVKVIDWEGIRLERWMDTRRDFDELAAREMRCVERMSKEYSMGSCRVDRAKKLPV